MEVVIGGCNDWMFHLYFLFFDRAIREWWDNRDDEGLL